MNDYLDKTVSKLTIDEKAISLCIDTTSLATSSVRRLKIDGLNLAYASHGLQNKKISKATCFAEPSTIGRSWNPELIKITAQAIAEEAKENNISMLLAPTLNVKRSLRSASGFASYSEDPYLCSVLGKAFIYGLSTRGVGACPKYLSAVSYESKRLSRNHIIDERALREIYYYAFEQALFDKNVWAVMVGCGKLNGEYAAESTKLLYDLIRKEWGFKGLIISDIGSVKNEAESLKAGIDIIYTGSRVKASMKICESVKDRRLDEKVINEAVRRLFSTILKAKSAQKTTSICDYNANHNAALKAARESIVLLKNKNKTLPLKKYEKLAIIGSDIYVQAESRESVMPTRQTSLQAELKNESADIIYCQGYSDDEQNLNSSLAKQALEACKQADKIIFVAGTGQNSIKEGCDRKNLYIPNYQKLLLEKLSNLGKPLIVLITGEAVIPRWEECADAIVFCGFLGQAGASAVKDVLYGYCDATGRLAETIPLSEEDMPDNLYFDENNLNTKYAESIYTGYRYYLKSHKKMAYPFGYGLSYAEFEYSRMKISAQNTNYKISIDVTNTSEVSGAQVIQIYVGEQEPKIFKPLYELKAFKKVWLEPKQTKSVEITLDETSFMFFDARIGQFNASPGKYSIYAATSCENIIDEKTIEIFYGTFTSKAHTDTQLPHYYNIDKKIFTIPHLEFEELLGYHPQITEENKTYTMQSTLGQIKTTKIGKDILSLTASTLMEQDIFINYDDIPLETLAPLSGYIFSLDMAEAAVRALNGDKTAYKDFKAAYKANRLN